MEHVSQLAPYILLLVLVLVISTGIRIVKEHERFVVIILGRYAGLKGPGLLVKWPSSASKWYRVALRDEGVYLGDSLVKVQDAVFPVEGADTYEINAKVYIVSFASGRIKVTQRL